MLKVVVIDGNAISRNLLTTLLMNGGYEVVGDSNASSAGIAGMIKLQPQIVCIDIGAADEEGMKRLDTVCAGLPKSLLFMVSSSFDAATVEGCAKRGVRGFIVKPFKVATVLNTIRNAVLKVVRKHQTGGAGDDQAAGAQGE